MSEAQASAQRGKKRGRYNMTSSESYAGRGNLKCGVCGRPIVEHEMVERCEMDERSRV